MYRAVYIVNPSKQNNHGVKKMARKENIYAVSTESNQIVRVSRTFQAAIEFRAMQYAGTVYLCTSEFQCLKKGDTISNIVDFL